MINLFFNDFTFLSASLLTLSGSNIPVISEPGVRKLCNRLLPRKTGLRANLWKNKNTMIFSQFSKMGLRSKQRFWKIYMNVYMSIYIWEKFRPKPTFNSSNTVIETYLICLEERLLDNDISSKIFIL